MPAIQRACRRMKIGFVVQRYGPEVVGGAERYTRDIAIALAQEGHEIEVVTSCAESYADWKDVYSSGSRADHGVTVHRLPVLQARPNDRFVPLHLRAVSQRSVPLWPWGQSRWAQMMGPELKEGAQAVAAMAARCDVTVMVGYHYATSLTLSRSAAAWGAVVVVPTAHPEGAFHVGIVRQLFDYADLAICLSQAEADLVHDVHGPDVVTRVVPCPVAVPDVPSAEQVAAVRELYDLGSDEYFVVVGRIDPAKGSNEAVEYVEFVRSAALPNLRLVMIGPGDLAERGSGTVVTGFVNEDDKLAIIAGATALLQPSYMESFSLALMEGWLLGRPALVQGHNRVLAEHVRLSGGGFAYEGLADFEAASVAVVESVETAGALGAAGSRYCREAFAWSAVRDPFVDALQMASTSSRARLMR